MNMATVLRISTSHGVTVKNEPNAVGGSQTLDRFEAVRHFPRCLRPSDASTDFQAMDFPRQAIWVSLTCSKPPFLPSYTPHGRSVGTHQSIPISTLVN